MNARQQILRVLLAAIALLLSSSPIGNIAFARTVAGSGYVEEARYLPDDRQLVVSGWAAPEKPNVFSTNLIVRLGEQEIYRGRIERSERADVVRNTGRADWLWSGFAVRLSIPASITGPQPLTARMRLGDGTEIELGIASSGASPVHVGAPPPGPSLLARLALLAALAFPLLALAGPSPRLGLAKRAGRFGEAGLFGTTLVLAFALLVAAGWSGSSLGLLLDDSGVSRHERTPWIGELRPVRSDEWQVIAPLAVSQATHQPAFPRINRNLGTDGQNMLVIGMTGVPVAHVSALAKPATWGFFLFDLRRALAWYWWLPFFACFAAVWLLLLRFFELDWRLAAGLALTVSASPYSVVFSGWPAYAVFFPAAGLLAADAAMRARQWQWAVSAGAVLGLAVAGFALVLYPAWQISLAWLFVPFALAWLATRREELRWGAPQVGAAAVALALAVMVLGSWWFDARDAVASIRGTVYPGQRSVEIGGDVDRWFLIKGLISPITMYSDSSLMLGASDAGSAALFIVPLFAAVAFRFIRARRIDPVAAALCGFMAVTLVFMYIGFPAGLARWTLWGSTTSYRLDLALGFAQVLLLAWLASPAIGFAGSGQKPAGRGTALAVGALAALHAAWLYRLVPPAIVETVPVSFIALSLLALGGGGYLLLRGRHLAFFCVYGALMLSASLPFNPLGLALQSISPGEGIAPSAPAGARVVRDLQAIAVIGHRNWAMVLPAAGLPVVNSVFYYPQEALWRRLDPEGKLRVVYNRYQRVLFELAPLQGSRTYRIDSPRLDEVRVTLHPVRFDFRLLGARSVLAGAADSEVLKGNSTLRPARSSREWTLFEVVP